MFSLDRHSLEKFIENPEGFVLRKQHGKICAEKKGAWTWIKSHLLDRQSYNLQKIVPYLRDREDVSQKLQETVDKKIEQFNQKYESKGHKIVPLKTIHNTTQKVSQGQKKRLFFGEQKTLQFNINEPPNTIATQKPHYQELKEDRGINPSDGKLGKLPASSVKMLLNRFLKGKKVSEKHMSDAFEKDCRSLLFKLAGKANANSKEIKLVIAPAISQVYSQAFFVFSNGSKKWDFEAFQKEVIANLKTVLEKPAEQKHQSIKDTFLSYFKQNGMEITPEDFVSAFVKRHQELLTLFFNQKC